MVDQPIEVDVQIAGLDVSAGRLWTHRHGQSESATFSYRDEYLERADSYELDPGLALWEGQHHTAVGQSLFGAMSDSRQTDGDDGSFDVPRRSAPTTPERNGAHSPRWTSCSAHGTTCDRARCDSRARQRPISRRRHRGRAPPGGPITPAETPPKSSNATNRPARICAYSSTAAAHSAARDPSARARQHGHVGIAKFPSSQTDTWDVIRWESVALTLAANAGITVLNTSCTSSTAGCIGRASVRPRSREAPRLPQRDVDAASQRRRAGQLSGNRSGDRGTFSRRCS